jgi:hypothetical protein
LDLNLITKSFRDNGKITIKEGNGLVVTFLKPELWNPEMGQDWVYLLFDLFQIRSICEPYSEVSLDIVEFASKPTIYESPANKLLPKGPVVDGYVRFSVIREPEWNKLLFQLSQPVIVGVGKETEASLSTEKYFPLLAPSTKELFLGPEGEVKIIKG